MNKNKLVLLGILFSCVISFYLSSEQVAGAEIQATPEEIGAASDLLNYQQFIPKTAILIDSETGLVLWENEADVARPIASLSKIMTAYLVFQGIEEGKITEDSAYVPSEKIINISQIYALSNNNMAAGTEYTIKDLLHLLFIPSSNAATVMLGDILMPDDEAGFVEWMNETATELGMENSVFFNNSGAAASVFQGYYLPEGIDPEGDNLSTARDLSILVYNFLKKYPQVLAYTEVPSYTLHPGQPSEELLETYNFSLPGMSYALQGVDGLKTGSSSSADYGFVGTAKREDTRLIGVVLGAGSWELQQGEEERHAFFNTLMNRGFDDYEYKKVLSAGEQTINGSVMTLKDDLFGLVQKEQESALQFQLNDNGVALTTDLTLVTNKIEQQTVAVEKQEKETADSKLGNLDPTTISPRSRSILLLIQDYIYAIIIGIIALITIIFSTFFKKRSSERSRKKTLTTSGRILLIIGLLELLVALVVSGLVFFNII